ncbi:hypothetical protein DW877_13030 [[Clostridium] symbiosum]|nr:hypothetical protein DW877_13030 [[Clostridium] symbiosum]
MIHYPDGCNNLTTCFMGFQPEIFTNILIKKYESQNCVHNKIYRFPYFFILHLSAAFVQAIFCHVHFDSRL